VVKKRAGLGLLALAGLAGALLALLLGGFLSQSDKRPPGKWSWHCADIRSGPPPSPHASLTIGLNSVWNNDCNLAAVAGAGVTMERLELGWATIEPHPGRWTFAAFDSQVAAAARHGITVLPVLLDLPAWTGAARNVLPSDPGQFSQYVAHVVARYGPHGDFWREHHDIPSRPVTWFEVWNEPYFSEFSGSGIDPGRYARLFKASVIAGRRADPAARFLIQADLFGQDSEGTTAPWIGPMFQAVPDLSRYVGGVAVHPYSGTESPDDYTPSDPRGQFRRIEQIRQQFAAHGAGSRPFWITELGWSTCPANPAECVSDPAQADYLRRAFQIVKADYSPWVKAVFTYNYRDSVEGNGTDDQAWFGLVRRAGQPKPAWNVLRAAAAG
jgi:hypothetical protein